MAQRLLPTVFALLLAVPTAAQADTVRTAYTRALEQERVVRDARDHATPDKIRRVVASYERIVARYPASGYSDNALWQAANLSILAYERSGEARDRKKAERLLTQLTFGYPASSLISQAETALHDLDAAPVRVPSAPAATSGPPRRLRDVGKVDIAADTEKPARIEATTAKTEATSGKSDVLARAGEPVLLREIQRTPLPDGVRVTVALDSEVAYHQEELPRPKRVFFDLKGVRAVPALQDVTLKYDGDVVKEIRLGRHPQSTTRVVLDLAGVDAYSVYSLYNPYRLVIDFRRNAAALSAATAPAEAPVAPAPLVASLPAPPPPTPKYEAPKPEPTVETSRATLPSTTPTPRSLPPPAPVANSNGKFSISRQLGLSVSRIVIDAGHGGHDPGAQANGINEAELTLDVALRLQKLLMKQPGIEVVMTRDTDVFIPLQERTAIANREGADLFLSIHANASRSVKARGIESYFLNFASNPEAEAVAARENAGSGQSMHALPDIVKAIALNNKINESRDFAEIVQGSMIARLSARNRQVKDLGVKQAPFVVLIGASLPSVLAEISFVTIKLEGVLLKTGAYRQQIAQALQDAVMKYQQGFRRVDAVRAKKATE